MKRLRGPQWLLASLPLIPLLLVFWAYRLPPDSVDSVALLTGPWEAHSAVEGLDPFASGSDWKIIQLPGSFELQGLPPGHLWLRRHFIAPIDSVGHDAAFILGGARGASLKVSFNGQVIGLKGEPSLDFIGTESGAEKYFAPAHLVKAGENTLTIEVWPLRVGYDGVTDPRLLFGRHDVLGPWSFHARQVREVIERGTLVVIAFLVVLLLSLWVLQGGRVRVDLYRSSLVILSAAAFYLCAMSGFLVSAFMSGPAQMQLIVTTIFVLGFAICEFVEAYYLQRITRFRYVNRVVSGVALVISNLTFSERVTQVYSLWLFVLVIYSLALAARDLVKQTTVFGPLVAMATFLVAGAGVSDLLGDLDVVYAPRLFTFAIANLATMSGAVVVAEFLQLARENTRLSASLQLRAEELADALVKAEEGSRIKSEFLANTSHELRTPLNAIINIPQGLLEQFHEVRRVRCAGCGALFELEGAEAAPASCPSCARMELALEAKLIMELAPEETARLLKSIVRSGNHLLAVVNDILDYSKLEAGRVVLHRESVGVDVMLEDLRLAMEPVATLAGVKLVLEGQAAGVTLEVDRVKVSQVLINLVGNAIKFSDGKGTVTVGASVGDALVTLSVRDEGIGIAPEHQALIFEGFRQVEGSNTRRFGGSGLGLAISKRLVGLHGGTLRVDSVLGSGSTFFIELPLLARADEAALLPDAEVVVVVVDDEATAVDTTSIALKPLGCRVVAVMDPREAMARLRASRPSLIVLDVMMPRISGLELLRKIKADPDLQGVPVLVSSAYPDNRTAAEALGAVFIAKPWRPGELLRAASSLLAMQRKSP